MALAWALASLAGPGKDAPPDGTFGQVPGFAGKDTTKPSYPDDWRTDLRGARQRARFPVILPDQPEANANNLAEVFIRDDASTISLIFPLLEKPQSPIRIEYLEIDIGPWAGGDPRTEYLDFVAKAGTEGYEDRYAEIGGHPAIVVGAHSKGDFEQANAAFLRTVVAGVELQIYGGEDMNTLIRVAEDLIGRYARGP